MKLLTVEEVVDLLRMSRDTVYRLAARGQLPGRKIGRLWRFPADELERYLRGRPGESLAARTTDVVPEPDEPQAGHIMADHKANTGS